MQNKNLKIAALFLLIALVGRIMPHLPNATPLISLCLFAGARFSKSWALACIAAALLLSDLALAIFYHYPIFGAWQAFTYAWFAVVILTAHKFLRQDVAAKSTKTSFLHGGVFLLASSFGFWAWSNLGVWLVSGGIYPKTLAGIVSCYAMALPFLQSQLCGDCAWFVAIWCGFNLHLLVRQRQVA